MMPTSRLEAFSDGVMAVIITIMVLELKAPDAADWSSFISAVGTGIATYVLSFIYVGIYWNNHHHLFHLARRLTGGVLWANLHLLFWLSLLPLTTSWMDSTGFARVPVIVYGIDLCAAAVAYWILQTALVHGEGEPSRIRAAMGADVKGKASPVIYAAAILVMLWWEPAWAGATWIAMACYVVVAVMWLVPDRRVERFLARERADRESATS